MIILRGLPGSGKSTFARGFVSTFSPGIAARLNRDDMREGVFPRVGSRAESHITSAQHAMAHALLSAGVSVVVDEMNLNHKSTSGWVSVAKSNGASIHVIYFPTPVAVCESRDQSRPRPVGSEVIRNKAARYRVDEDGSLPSMPLALAEAAASVSYVDYATGYLMDYDSER